MELKSQPSITKSSSVVDVLEAGYLNDVEVDVSHEVWGGGVGGLEAIEEHVVTSTVRFTVEWVVGEVVAAGEGAHLRGAEVVRAAAAVQAPVRAQVVVVCGYVTRAAPLCTYNKYNHELNNQFII